VSEVALGFGTIFAFRCVAMAMSRAASLRPHGLLSLLRPQACISTDATSAAEKVLKAAKLQPGTISDLVMLPVRFPSVF